MEHSLSLCRLERKTGFEPGGRLERRAFPPLFNPYAGNFPLNLFYMLFDFDGYLI